MKRGGEKLVPAKDVTGCFRKRTGYFTFVRVSDSAIKFYKLDPNLVHGVCYNGNMCSVKPDTLVAPMPFSAIARDAGDLISYEKTLGCKTTSYEEDAV